jgi:hypothetical protein
VAGLRRRRNLRRGWLTIASHRHERQPKASHGPLQYRIVRQWSHFQKVWPMLKKKLKWFPCPT